MSSDSKFEAVSVPKQEWSYAKNVSQNAPWSWETFVGQIVELVRSMDFFFSPLNPFFS